MRITFVVPILEVSGGARIVSGHAERLAACGHDVHIVSPRRERSTLKQLFKRLLGRENLYVPQERTTVRTVSVPLHVPKHFGKILMSDVPEADCIIATWWETAEWISNFPPSKGAKIHFIQHYEAFAPMPADRVDAVWRLPFFKITIAQWLVDLGRERFGIEEMALVPNSVEDRFRSDEPRTRGNNPTVGFLFHNADFKDFGTSRTAVSRLKEMRPDARFVSFGTMMPGPGEVPDHVEFHHLPSQETIAEIYRRCDVWLSTSRTEGFNLPPLEAMAGGCPAVCSKTGRPLEIIQDGINGYLVDAGDVEGFASALAKILELSEQSWADMSEAARHSVAHPSWTESSALFAEALTRASESVGS